jgi:anti-repressor protein
MNPDLALTLPAHVATVDARQLHETLGVGRDFTTWIKEQIERLGMVEGRDYHLTKSGEMVERAQGGGLARDVYSLELSRAEMIALSTRTPEAQAAMQALLRVKALWNNPTAVIARALQMSAAQNDQLRSDVQSALTRVAELEPKAQTFDALMGVDDALPMVKAANVLAKTCPRMGRNRLFSRLRNLRIFKQDNTPYQEHIDANRFRVVEKLWTDPHGKDHVHLQTYVTQRGLAYLQRLLGAQPGLVN